MSTESDSVRSMTFRMKKVTGDGNCLFRSFKAAYEKVNPRQHMTHQEYRSAAMQALDSVNLKRFYSVVKPLLVFEYDILLDSTPPSAKKYLIKLKRIIDTESHNITSVRNKQAFNKAYKKWMSVDGVWAGQGECDLLAKRFGVNVYVVYDSQSQHIGSDLIRGKPSKVGSPSGLTYSTDNNNNSQAAPNIYLLSENGNHFNVLSPVSNTSSSNSSSVVSPIYRDRNKSYTNSNRSVRTNYILHPVTGTKIHLTTPRGKILMQHLELTPKVPCNPVCNKKTHICNESTGHCVSRSSELGKFIFGLRY